MNYDAEARSAYRQMADAPFDPFTVPVDHLLEPYYETFLQHQDSERVIFSTTMKLTIMKTNKYSVAN